MRLRINGDLRTRFEARVDRSGGLEVCHLWVGAGIRPDGYAYFSVTSSEHVPVHVIAWTLENGPVPDGMQLDHECHNRAVLLGQCQPGPCDHRRCCNDLHVSPCTPLEHRARTLRTYSSVNVGSLNGQAVLCEDQVRLIKLELAAGTKNVVLARRYNVTQAAICDIKNGRNWAHVVI